MSEQIAEILRQIDAVLVERARGEIEVRLTRGDYDAAPTVEDADATDMIYRLLLAESP